MLLAIETSCDETALAVFDVAAFLNGERRREAVLRAEIVSSQVALHQPYGGVVPELAAREHLLNLPPLVNGLFENARCTPADILGVAVTRGPGLNGCLLVGISFAKSFALGRKIPFLALHHLEAHLFAAELGDPIEQLEYPSLALLVSGGHTELILLESFRKYQVLARTRDDAVGEAFDKAATLLGLPYPGGPALAQCAEAGAPGAFEFPIGMSKDETAFSFSGVKTAVLREVQKLGERIGDEKVRGDMARAIEECFVSTLSEKTERALEKHRPKSLILTGGVAANTALRASLANIASAHKIPFRVPERRWCTDNAGMIGMLALRIIEQDNALAGHWRGQANESSLAEHQSIGSLPRWPIEHLHL